MPRYSNRDKRILSGIFLAAVGWMLLETKTSDLRLVVFEVSALTVAAGILLGRTGFILTGIASLYLLSICFWVVGVNYASNSMLLIGNVSMAGASTALLLSSQEMVKKSWLEKVPFLQVNANTPKLKRMVIYKSGILVLMIAITILGLEIFIVTTLLNWKFWGIQFSLIESGFVVFLAYLKLHLKEAADMRG